MFLVTVISINDFLASKKSPVAPQHPHSPLVHVPFLFLRLKTHIKEQSFVKTKSIQTLTNQMKAIPVSKFQH